MRWWLVWMLPLSLVLSVPRGAAAGDASDLGDGDTGFDASTEGSASVRPDVPSSNASASGDQGAPLGCDGALCDTTNGGACGVAGREIGHARVDCIPIALLVPVGLLYGRRRYRTGTLRPAPGRPRGLDRPIAVRSI